MDLSEHIWLLPGGFLQAGPAAGGLAGLELRQDNGIPLEQRPAGVAGMVLLDPVPDSDLLVRRPGREDIRLQVGDMHGRVRRAGGGVITGWARSLRAPEADQLVVALDADGRPVARAVARAGQGGGFVMVLPAALVRAPVAQVLRLVVAGSDCQLEGGLLVVGGPGAAGEPTARLRPQARRSWAVRIKISCPNLREAPMWGDYHFANSLAAALERVGLVAGVDPVDSWYAPTAPEDVVLTLRGRQPVQLDPDKINIMWLISHPDRVEDAELERYDHVAVASDVHAAALRARGLKHVSVMHQATDAQLFGAVEPAASRRPAALFVGNSRREYRTMVKWCIRHDIPLELYGGGWDGIVAPDMVRAPAVANGDLPGLYASHMVVLNDHWDSMREGGFLSNRLFDASATGTPVLSDPVAGLAEVFGDTIPTAADGDSFAATLRAMLADPAVSLARAARARAIVLGAHTFDHRAQTLADLIDRLASARRPDSDA